MCYLRKGELGENTKIVGAVSNRTFNYYTQGDTLPCANLALYSELNEPSNAAYQVATIYSMSDLNQKIKFKNIGIFKGYQIDWYNALDGSPFGTTILTSNAFGVGHLAFPDTLTGNDTSPILFFKLYPYGDTFLSPIESNEFETALPQEFHLAEELDPIETTIWKDSLEDYNSTLLISISPNPTTGIVNCQVNGDFSSLNWLLVNSNGQQLEAGQITNTNFYIDLSIYSNGIYYIKIMNKSMMLTRTIKIVKQ